MSVMTRWHNYHLAWSTISSPRRKPWPYFQHVSFQVSLELRMILSTPPEHRTKEDLRKVQFYLRASGASRLLASASTTEDLDNLSRYVAYERFDVTRFFLKRKLYNLCSLYMASVPRRKWHELCTYVIPRIHFIWFDEKVSFIAIKGIPCLKILIDNNFQIPLCTAKNLIVEIYLKFICD